MMRMRYSPTPRPGIFCSRFCSTFQGKIHRTKLCKNIQGTKNHTEYYYYSNQSRLHLPKLDYKSFQNPDCIFVKIYQTLSNSCKVCCILKIYCNRILKEKYFEGLRWVIFKFCTTDWNWLYWTGWRLWYCKQFKKHVLKKACASKKSVRSKKRALKKSVRSKSVRLKNRDRKKTRT